MIDCRFRPLDRWPRKKTPSCIQKSAPFRAGYASTLDMLETELNHLKAKNIVIEADFKLKDIRNDGWPRSSARTSAPGVIVSFDSKFGAMTLPCDHFNAWEDNLRAIAFHLHYLRKSDLYGVSLSGEQYRGWAALPSNVIESRAQAAAFIAHHAGINDPDDVRRVQVGVEYRESAYRIAAKKLHPDVGGNHELFQRLQQAITMLRGGVNG